VLDLLDQSIMDTGQAGPGRDEPEQAAGPDGAFREW
jgi:hypothetical protein